MYTSWFFFPQQILSCFQYIIIIIIIIIEILM